MKNQKVKVVANDKATFVEVHTNQGLIKPNTESVRIEGDFVIDAKSVAILLAALNKQQMKLVRKTPAYYPHENANEQFFIFPSNLTANEVELAIHKSELQKELNKIIEMRTEQILSDADKELNTLKSRYIRKSKGLFILSLATLAVALFNIAVAILTLCN